MLQQNDMEISDDVRTRILIGNNSKLDLESSHIPVMEHFCEKS